MLGLFYTITYKNIFLLTVFSLFLTNCNYKTQKADAGGSGGQIGLSTDAIIDDQLIMSYSLKSCQNCHGGAQAPLLDSAAAMKTNILKVIGELDTKSMPPTDKGYSSLSECQVALVKAWADGSAKTVGEVASCKGSGVGTTPELPLMPIELMPLNYETLKSRILLPKCVLCHDSANISDPDLMDAAFIPFTTYLEITTNDDNKKLWSAPAAASKIHREITADDGMPPLKSKLGKLTDKEVDFIDRWIDAGLPE